MQKVKTIFIGTAEFGILSLEALSNLEFIDLVAVVTQPDKPAGRKQEPKASPVKQWYTKNVFNSSLEEGLRRVTLPKLEQPESIKKSAQMLMDTYKPELIVVAAYGQIIPTSILDYPKYNCLNLHGSLLPKLRGAVPVHMAILQGLDFTGVTLQKMVKKMDAGPIIQSKDIRLIGKETTQSLMSKLAKLASDIIVEDLEKWVNGGLEEIKQNEEDATYCYMSDISKEKAEITFDTPIIQAERMVRAFNPWPVAWFVNNKGKRVKVFKAVMNTQLPVENDKELFSIFKKEKRLFLHLIDGDLELLELQVEGKQKGFASDYLYLGEH